MFNRHVSENLSSYLDNELSDKERLEVELHLKTCEACAKELSQLKNLSLKLKAWPVPELRAGFEGVVRDKIVRQEIERGRVPMDKKTLKVLIPSGVLAGILLLVFVNAAVTRGIQGRMRESADYIGEQFSPQIVESYKNEALSFGFASGNQRMANRKAMRLAKAKVRDNKVYEKSFSTSQYEPYYSQQSMTESQSARLNEGMGFGGIAHKKTISQLAVVGASADKAMSRLESDTLSINNEAVNEESSGDGTIIVVQPSLPATGIGDMIIRTAEVRLEVADAKQAYAKVNLVCKDFGGYVTASNFLEDAMSHIILRIPKDKFTEALDKLGGLGKVENISSNSQDVHQQYANLKTELDTVMVVYNKMVEALKKKQATIPDVVRLESQLNPVLSRIEGLKNALESLNNSVSFTTITVYFHESELSTNALKKGIRFIQESLIVAGLNLIRIVSRAIPLLVIFLFYFVLAIPIILVAKYMYRKYFIKK